ncbi:hypothetical protein NBT05_00650 [Aquimarina sp. ERC-38]|uniref:hypothetical protein n=1 Tax=Aquimarina sp. ERC-38 TaxID=2949996 RepID=UPI002247FC3E|nr:hypothetical protein [Aquimarina sp. ERC-38]UZO81005.1 hypothetical protein NBT05_00650 [Aquimarina sp. ERC-38]
MRTYYFISILLIFLACSACQKDEDTSIIEDQISLLGTWKLTELSVKDGIISSTILDETFTIGYTSKGKDFNYELIVAENPNKVEGKGSYTSVTTTTALGKTETYEEKVTDFIINGNWKLKNNQLLITSQEQTIVGDILEFTDDHIIIQQVIDDRVEDSVLGTEAITQGTLTYRLER